MSGAQGTLPRDYSILLAQNFDRLNNRPQFDASTFLDKESDWFLLDYLREMKLSGLYHEQILNGFLTMIGSLSNGSYCRNLLTDSPVWLNVFSHVLGGTGECWLTCSSSSVVTVLGISTIPIGLSLLETAR
jgi:hypothetical protein